MTPPAVGTPKTVRLSGLCQVDGSPRRLRGVLIIDDQEPVSRMLGVWMHAQGFVVWLAAGSPEAVELYQRHRDAIDVVLLDVQMPGRAGDA